MRVKLRKSKRVYHYVLTVEACVEGFVTRRTFHNLLVWSGTECEALEDRIRYASEQTGFDTTQLVTIFWSFKPNNL